MTLTEVLADPARKEAVVRDGLVLIEEEVRSKGGLTGMALKAGYKTVQSVKPGFVRAVLAALLPEFAPAVDPFHAKARESGDVHGYFRTHAPAIADALLSVTDRQAKHTDNRVVQRAYQGLRSQAHGHVVAAVPGLARLIEKHVP